MKLPPFLRNLVTSLMTTYFRYVLMGVAFVVLLIGFFALIQPQLRTVQQDGVGALQEVEDRLTLRTDYLNRLKDMARRYQDVVSQQAVKTSDLLPNNPEIGKLYLTIDQIVRATGYSLDSIAVTKGESLGTTSTGSAGASATATSGTIQILDINLTFSGPSDYLSYKRLLTNLERSIRIFDVPQITFNPSRGSDTQSSNSALNQLNLEVKTYYLEQKK